MKMIFKIIILAMILPTVLYAIIPDGIKHAIQKSKPALLKEATEYQELTDNQKNECLKLANEVLRIRQDKINFRMRTTPKKPILGTSAKIASIAIGAIGVAWFIGFMKLISETQNGGAVFNVILAMVLWESLWGYSSYKLWQYGALIDTKFSEKYKFPNKKHLNALKIKNKLLSH